MAKLFCPAKYCEMKVSIPLVALNLTQKSTVKSPDPNAQSAESALNR